MNYTEKLKSVAKLMTERIETMKRTDEIDGKKDTGLEDYIFWAFEEVTENDGVVIELVNQ